jgi:predicted Rossmann fold flavoprotein
MSEAVRRFDVIVIGAGAAGLMCAAVAGQRKRSVALLDHGSLPGRKILISGGGRCNFTNIHTDATKFLSNNPHFAKSALALYTPSHFIELVEKHRIAYHEKTLGQLFCDHSAHAILAMLLAECESGSVEHVADAHSIRVERTNSGFSIHSAKGEFECESLVIATGGLSIPKMGATGFGYDLARQFGLKMVEPRPALVPLLLGGKEADWTALAGVSALVRVTTPATGRGAIPAFVEKLLVTHRGLSGPAILQISSYWRTGQPVVVDLLPECSAILDPLRTGRRDQATLLKTLGELLPRRLAEHMTVLATPQGWTNASLDVCEQSLHGWPFHPTGTEGYAKAEVTAGGVDTNELNARSLEAKKVPGLYFIGEVVDVTGHLGGFNFQWAWASAVAAGRQV